MPISPKKFIMPEGFPSGPGQRLCGTELASGTLELAGSATGGATIGEVKINDIVTVDVDSMAVAGRVLQTKGADVASGGTVTLGADGNVFAITGTTTINYITTTGWQAGAIVVLLFGTSVTVAHNTGSVPVGTAAMLLSGAANLSATANDSLTLVYDGTNWREIARTVI